jgi:hypothetical protein
MKPAIFTCLSVLFLSSAFGARVKLSTIAFEVPDAMAAGNKVSVAPDGMSTYAWNRLRTDSTSYYYSYSFKLDNALFEFRETHRVDIYESFETFFKPKLKRRTEQKNYRIPMFQNTSNEFLKKSFNYSIVEYDKGMRKITLVYEINKTSQFLVSVKTMYPAETFIRAQKNLDTILMSAVYEPPVLPEFSPIVQKGELANRTSHHLVKMPYFLSIDFNNPVVQATPDNGFVAVFAHAKGSEIFTINSNYEIVSVAHHDKIIHDIAISEKGFFSLSSTDYNLLSYGTYPSLYLNKHNHSGEVELSQVVFKNNDLKIPGNQVFDFYSRDNVCLEIADTFGIIYMNAEKRYSDMKVVQSGVYKTFSLDGGILKKGNQDLYHVSHCFAQASTHDDKYAYLLSVGDGYPRGVYASKVDLAVAKDSTDTTSIYHHQLYKVGGILSDNYVADTHISEPLLYNNFIYVIIETEEGARTDLEDNPYSTNRGNNDLFLVKCELGTKELIVKQITKTQHIEEVAPKFIDLGDDLLLVYTEVRYDKQSGRNSFGDKYLLLDERGGRESLLENFDSFYAHEERVDYKMPDSPLNRDGSNLIKMADGSVIWVRLMKNAQQLEVIRFN